MHFLEQLAANYREYSPELKVFLLRYGCPPQLAEDIVQEAFYRALKHLALPLGRIRNFRAWLYKTTYNLYIDCQRQHRDPPTQQQLQVDPRGPAEALIAKEEGELARLALERVPERQRAAVLLCDVAELSYREAAEVINASDTIIRGLLYRGRMRLREEYRKLEGGGGDEG